MEKQNNTKFGLSAEYKVAKALDKLNIRYHHIPGRQNIFGCDFITEHGNIEIKRANPSIKKYYSKKKKELINKVSWTFNCHHKGVKQKNIDIYICTVSGYEDSPDIHFILPSYFARYTIKISERQIDNGKFDYFMENWNILLDRPKNMLKPVTYYIKRVRYCKYCGKHIEKGNPLYCSEDCKQAARKKAHWVDLICFNCGRGYEILRSQYTAKINRKGYNHTFCCMKCYHEYLKGIKEEKEYHHDLDNN